MKKMVFILGAFLLGHTVVANAATDWTPYLKPVLSGCDYVNPTEKLPARYKASIASKKVKGNPKNEGEEVYTTQHIQQTLMQICQNYQKQDLDILDMTVNRGTLEQHFLEVARRNEI